MFNRKTNVKIKKLETEISGLKSILEVVLKCECCGDKAPIRICRKYEYNKDGKLAKVDSFLCDKCLEKKK